MTQDSSSPTRLRASKAMRSFLIIWSGQAFSLLGSGIVQFALIWYLTTTTGSPAVLAMASIAGLLPQLLLGPVAGALVDRWSRRWVMVVADSASAFATLLLAFSFFVGWSSLWLIYLVLLLRSLAGAFHWPAMQAATPLLVPTEQLTRVAGMNQVLQGIANLGVPPLAALLVAWLPMQGILAIDVVTAIIAIIPLLFIAIPNPIRQELTPGGQGDLGRRPSVFDDLRAGFAFVWRWQGLFLLFCGGLIVNFFGAPAFILAPIMVSKTFDGTALDLAWVQASSGLGIMLGGLVLSVWRGFPNRMVTFFSCQLLSAAALLLIGFTPPAYLPLVMVGLVISAIMNAVSMGNLFAMLQMIVPNVLQGRVFTLLASFNGGMVPLALLVAAPITERVGVQLWFTLAGIVVIIICLCGFLIPTVLHLEDQGKQLVATQAQEIPHNPCAPKTRCRRNIVRLGSVAKA